MSSNLSYFSWRIRRGRPILVGNRELIPITSVLMLRWPNGGFVLNRPIAIQINQDGASTTIKITDFQHIARLLLLAAISIHLVVRLLIRTQTRRPKQGERPTVQKGSKG